ncbi:MAG: glycosyltransferase [bacterium]
MKYSRECKTIFKVRSRTVFVVIVIIVSLLVFHKIYAPYTIQNFNAVNHRNIDETRNSVSSDSYSFAVVGNVKNSIAVFDKRILPEINRREAIDFIVSAGNNVVASGEGKYRVLNRTLERMEIPFITCVGQNEVENDGYRNFYKFFGPFYFSFAAEDSYFIFLDTTGHSSFDWQSEWLEKQLDLATEARHKFVFMNRPPLKVELDLLLEDEPLYVRNKKRRQYYQQLFAKHDVTAVFSANLPIYYNQKIKGVEYFVIGGSGGRIPLENTRNFYHYLEVDVNFDRVNYKLRAIEGEIGSLVNFFFSIWVITQSFIYTNYITLLLVLLIIILTAYIFFRELSREIDYYQDMQKTDDLKSVKQLTIVMFTNTYFPVIGGVAISISRLARGLRKLGHKVYIFAPDYPGKNFSEEEGVIRCEWLYYYSREDFPMPITNVFNKQIDKKFEKLDPDIVHVHHPFLMGKKGLKLAARNELPVLYTYHTRLAKYAHYIPGVWLIRKFFINRISHWLIRHFSNHCQVVFAPTRTTRQYLRNIGVRTPVEILPTGVDFGDYNYPEGEIKRLREKYVSGDELLLISASRLSKEKNLYFLLRGLKRVKEKTDVPFKCLLAGDGPEKEKIAEFIEKHALEDVIELVGTIDYKKIGRYYLAADLFVFASTTETQGMVLLEAMAGHTPVVAVSSSGVNDVIENGYNGFRTAEKVDPWAAEVARLIQNPELCREMGNNAYQLATEHSIEKMAKKAEKIYGRLVNEFS